LWQHLADLRELWANALANMERIRPNLLSVGDKKLMGQLAGAVDLLDRRIDLLAKYSLNDMKLRREINSIPLLPRKIDETTNGDSPNS
jgi:hypothetical protein